MRYSQEVGNVDGSEERPTGERQRGMGFRRFEQKSLSKGGVRASKLILEEPMMIAGTEILAQGVTILDGDLKYDNRWLSLQVLRLLQLNRAKHSLGMSRISICFLSS